MNEMAQGTVLVVEDDKSIAHFIEMALTDEGYRAVLATDGEALQIAPAVHPDVILLDLMMPGMDGAEISRRLRDDPTTAETPIVLMSAYERKAPRDLPVNARLPKPFDITDLLDVVERYTGVA